MKREEIEKFIKAYKKREVAFVDNHNIGKARSRESLISKYISNRNKQLGTFITDAMVLRDIDFEEQYECSNPRFTKGCPQYYYLNVDELINYFSYRTLIKRGILPLNNHVNFLILYLMEIVNGLYGFSFREKREKLNQLLSLYTKGAKYRNLIKEGFEILYLQNYDKINKEEFESKLPFEILPEFTDGKKVELNGELFFSVYKLEKEIALSKKEEFIIKDCFSKIVNSIEKEYEVNSYSSTPLLEYLEYDYKTTFDSPLVKLRATYPINYDISFSRQKDKIDSISLGIHNSLSPFFTDIKKSIIKSICNNILDALRFLIWNIPLPIVPRNSINSYFVSKNSYDQKNAPIIFLAVDQWLSNNKYAIEAKNCSLSELKLLKQRKNFKLNIENLNDVRSKSSKIQKKLIIEDENESILDVKMQSPSEYFEELKKDTNVILKDKETKKKIDENPYSSLIENLPTLEKKVLKALLEDNLSLANSLCFEDSTMLSIVIENINFISEEYIEDIIILDEEVIDDYKQLLIENGGIYE